MKKIILLIISIYLLLGSLYLLNNYLKLPKNLYQISNTTKGLPKGIKVIDIEHDYDISRDNSFFILADNHHIYQIDPMTRSVIKDIKINGLKNPNGFSIIRFYERKKYRYEIYIADTDNHRIVQLLLPLDHNNITVEASPFISLKDTPLDVSFFKKYDAKGYSTSNNIAVLTNTNKIVCYDIKTKQKIDSFDVMLRIGKQKIPFKNLPYFRYSLIANWGDWTKGMQFRGYDYLEILYAYPHSSRSHVSLNLGKISKYGNYLIPDNDNKLLWIGDPLSYFDKDKKIIRKCMIQRAIKYTKDINMAIKYGNKTLGQKEIVIVAYKNSDGLSYNNVKYGFFGKLLKMSEQIFLHYLIGPFFLLMYIGH